ncbi:MAG TPA: zinc-ribbon domain-containing protein [Myxococcaceae bacterium]|nr:zinc-ribbon domain-containing protein [Myxococcaceae bacterium]
MRFRCEQCGTEYLLPDEAVARATRARCPRCKHSQPLRAGGVPLTTPPGGKSQIGRVALTTLPLPQTPAPEEEELFGELDWEADSQLEYVVGRSHVQFDDLPPAAPSIPPVSQPSGSPPGPLQAPSSAPIDFSDVEIDVDPPEPSQLRPGPQADAWPETDRSDPWRRTPLPPLQQPLSPVRPVAPSAVPPSPATPVTAGNQRRPQSAPAVSATTPRGGSPPTAIPATTPRPAPGPAMPRPSGGTPPRAAPAPVVVPEPCGACGGKLVDADDLASGVCGACRARTAAALGRGMPVSGPLAPAAAASTDPGTGELPTRTPTPPASPRRAFRTMPEPDRRGRVWLLLSVLALAALVSAVLWYLRVRPDPADLQRVADVLPRPGKKKPPAEARLPDGLEARLASWKAPPETRPVPELIDSAQADLAKDTEASQLAAEHTLEGALVQGPRSAEALGLWMEAIARGRGTQLPASELQALLQLGESALEQLGRQPPLQVGLASLLLVRGGAQDVERARSLGQSAVDATRPPAPPAPGAPPPPTPTAAPPSPVWGTRARLVLAEGYASSSAALALSLLQEVQQRDPGQHRVFNIRAAAHDAAGSPRAAAADLQTRLTVDPDEPRTARALARLWGQVGETAQARRLYERLQASPATQDGPAVIEMAALRAGAEHSPAEAVKLLSHAVQHGRLAGADLLRAQVCLARVARAAGEHQVAAQAVAAALAIAPDDVQAHTQGLLVDLDRGAADQAAAHLAPVLDRLGDPGLAALLEGRLRAAQQRWQAAAEAFDRAAQADVRRTDAELWAGAAWAMTGARERAMRSVALALQADPYRDGPGIPPLLPGDGLKGAAERLVLLSKDDRDGQPLLAEAVLRVHQGDAPGAEVLIDRILKTGATQALVLGWKSVLLGARGDAAGALARAQEAVAAGGRTSGFAQYALGSALLATGDVEGAQRALREAQTLSPALLAAQVRLAEAEARTGAIVSARERLQRVIVLDPEYASARRALYLLPPEG